MNTKSKNATSFRIIFVLLILAILVTVRNNVVHADDRMPGDEPGQAHFVERYDEYRYENGNCISIYMMDEETFYDGDLEWVRVTFGDASGIYELTNLATLPSMDDITEAAELCARYHNVYVKCVETDSGIDCAIYTH